MSALSSGASADGPNKACITIKYIYAKQLHRATFRRRVLNLSFNNVIALCCCFCSTACMNSSTLFVMEASESLSVSVAWCLICLPRVVRGRDRRGVVGADGTEVVEVIARRKEAADFGREVKC